jgi:signal peptidase II
MMSFRSLDGNLAPIIVVCTVVALDQLTKAVVTSRLVGPGRHVLADRSGPPRLPGRRRRWSLSVRQAVAIWLGAVACLEIILVLESPLSAMRLIGLGLSFGGATGNLADRLLRGGVVDFIAIGRWPTFNLADAAMVCGVGITAGSLLWALR